MNSLPPLEVSYVDLDTCAGETADVFVVIDVIRAFSTASFAFAGGLSEIQPVSTVEEALALKAADPHLLILGEVGGLPIPGFDFCNSPSELLGASLAGRRMAQRTSAGTQGVVLSRGAKTLLAASFSCAGATARYAASLNPSRVVFVVTGKKPANPGDEDLACAEYIAALLHGEAPDPAPYLERVRNSPTGRMFTDPLLPEFPAVDLDLCMRVDVVDFALRVDRLDGRLLMRPVRAGAEP